MSDGARGLILWIIAAVAILFLYAGVRNVKPASLITSFLNPSTPLTPIESGATTAATANTTTPRINANGTTISAGDTTPVGAIMGSTINA